jgi:cyanate permease
MGPWLGGMLKDTTGTYYVPFLVGAAMVMVSVIITAIIKEPEKKG